MSNPKKKRKPRKNAKANKAVKKKILIAIVAVVAIGVIAYPFLGSMEFEPNGSFHDAGDDTGQETGDIGDTETGGTESGGDRVRDDGYYYGGEGYIDDPDVIQDEYCDDGYDNDRDELIDCDDPDCTWEMSCKMDS